MDRYKYDFEDDRGSSVFSMSTANSTATIIQPSSPKHSFKASICNKWRSLHCLLKALIIFLLILFLLFLLLLIFFHLAPAIACGTSSVELIKTAQPPNVTNSGKAYSCATNTYPPSPLTSSKVRKFAVNLDDPPEDRWKHVVKSYEKELNDLVKYLKNSMDQQMGSYSKYFGFLFWLWGMRLPSSTYNEISGIVSAVSLDDGIDFRTVLAVNMFYDISAACTSLIGRKSDGSLIHGRNLDYAVDGKKDSEGYNLLAQYLRAVTIDVDFMRNGKILYSATTYAGYVAVLNGVKKGRFSMSLNQRDGGGNGIMAILNWVLGVTCGTPMAVVTRSIFEDHDNFEDARKYLETVPLISPIYFVLGGSKANEGHLITRGPAQNFNPLSLSETLPWILQTNYDHWNDPPRWDDRRNPGYYCMKQVDHFNTSSIFDVLSTRPILNLETTYTTVMDVNEGSLETFVRRCKPPCLSKNYRRSDNVFIHFFNRHEVSSSN